MKKIYLILSVAMLACIVPGYAQKTLSEEYIIQEKDTLWDISDSKFQDPFLWPKLWNVNPHINNPDLIYPGVKIIIPSREELMQQITPPTVATEKIKLPLRKEMLPTTESVSTTVGKTEKLPAEKHKKYLIDKNLYLSLGWISDKFPGIGKIVSTPSGREITGKDDIVYVEVSPAKILSGTGQPSLIIARDESSKSHYLIIRDIKTVKHPVSGYKVGHLIRVAGVLEIIGTDSGTSKARILRSFEDIQVGDGLIPYKETDPPVAPESARTPKIQGHIIESLFTKELSAEGDIVFIDKGQNDGLQAGDVLSVFSGSPVEKVIGNVQIVSLQPTTSAALIIKSDGEIISGLKLGQKE
ncbi:MAG: LysM peptidoglycan-binding domain-containing protein [Nitrospiraceae bacterium]|nr:MAG: LysM peptidoglycan-binding domain-containing protein [Nitrospiraceae bacterium]